MSTSWMFLTFFVFFFMLISVTKGLKCYVCSDDGEVSCENFDHANETFSRECSPTDKGCSMKIEGSKRRISRSCDSNQLDDCKEANGVEYCFCSWNLCNGNDKMTDISDDEDLWEGSGTRIFPTSSTTEVSLDIKHSSSDTLKFSVYFLFILTNAMII